jgi:hypothetical protein
MATPRRMGAALTYARRYALFTLVGIAGEDDLDAPDLATPTTTQKFEPPQQPNQSGNGRPNGGYSHRDQPAPIRRDAGARLSQTAPILEVEASAEVRDRLLTELSGLDSSEKAALWAHRSLPEKNRLVVADADRVEESFRARLASVTTPDTPLNGVPQPPKNAEAAPTAAALEPNSPEKKRRAKSIDKSTLALAEPRRIRDRDHVRYIAHQPCLVCGRQPSDAHHLRFAQSRALGRKTSDEFTVPLCRGHHREVHRRGDEAAWWIELNIDPTVTARSLWLETHPLPTAADGISIEGVAPLGTAGADRRNAKQKGPIDKQGPNDKTNPNIAAG